MHVIQFKKIIYINNLYYNRYKSMICTTNFRTLTKKNSRPLPNKFDLIDQVLHQLLPLKKEQFKHVIHLQMKLIFEYELYGIIVRLSTSNKRNIFISNSF